MSYHTKYELERLLVDGPAKTYQASEISTGRPVFMHLLGEIGDYAVLESLLHKVRWLQSSGDSNGSGRVIEIGDDTSLPYVVTDVLEPFSGLESWLADRCERAGAEAHVRCRQEVDRRLQAGDFGGAFEAVRVAVAEFPDSPDLQDLEETVKLLCRGIELCQEGRDEKGLELLWQAHKRDEADTGIRAVVVGTLLEKARALLESDAVAADELIQVALRLEPDNEVGIGLSLEVDPKRKEFIEWCVSQARHLQAEGDLEGARTLVNQGLADHPHERQLRALSEELAAPGERAPQPQTPSEEAAGEKPVQTPQARAKAAAAGTPPWKKLLTALAGLLGWFWRVLLALGRGLAGTTSQARRKLTVQLDRWIAALQKRIPQLAGFLARFKSHSPLLPVTVGVVAVLVLTAAGWVIWNQTAREPVATTPAFAVMLRSSQPGAAISINGEVCGYGVCQQELPPGSYLAEGRLAGFQPAAVPFEIGEQGPSRAGPIALDLLPLAPVLRLSSDLTGAKLVLDGEPLGQLEDGDFEIELSDLEPGEHTLQVADRGSQASIRFQTEPGAAPVILGPVETKELKAIVVAGVGPLARVYSAGSAGEATVDGEPLGTVGADGLALDNLTDGPHELIVGEGKARQTAVFESSASPTLAAFLSADRNVGGLRILTGEDGARVFLNGRPYRRTTRRGGLMLYLRPNKYRVRIEKEGFKTPPEKIAVVNKGERIRLDFELQAQPQTASLEVRQGVPGAEVWLGNRSLGRLGADGRFSATGLPPGKHSISLRKPLYQAKTLTRDFVAGETVQLAGSLEKALGTLRIELQPPDVNAQLTLRREGEAMERAVSDRVLPLAEGTYTITASAPGYQEFAATVRVLPEQAKTARLVLRRPPPAKAQPLATLATWEQGGGWERRGEALVRRGGDFVIAPFAPQAGVYEFSAMALRGRRLQWVVNYRDEDNYELFQIGKDHFRRIQVVNGDKSKAVKVRHPLGKDGYFRLRIEVSENAIVHSLLQNGDWAVVDRWNESDAAFTEGKFGFHIPSRDEYALESFHFLPARPSPSKAAALIP